MPAHLRCRRHRMFTETFIFKGKFDSGRLKRSENPDSSGSRTIAIHQIFLYTFDASGIIHFSGNRKKILNLFAMSDVHDKQTRSFNMSRIKGKNTRPEMLVLRNLLSNNIKSK